MTYTLGIDLGTTYTAAALARGGRAEVVALGYRATSVPTVVYLTEEGQFLVGDAADRRALEDPYRVAREFKRRVGDPTPLILGRAPIAVDRCLAEVLGWVTATVVETEGEAPSAVTVTHPANWGEFKRDVLRQAVRLAGLPEARLLAEPVAAATWYGQAERLGPGRIVAVYDLGGGTFDAAVLRCRTDGGFETLGRPEGIERLGGVDIDQAVLIHVLRSLGLDTADEAHSEDPATVTAVAQLRRACVDAKETLSSETSVTVPVALPKLHHRVLIRRNELEELMAPLLQPTIDTLQRVVGSAGLQSNELHAVLLVGGSSRIPLIASRISAALDRPIAVDAHPKHPVALGAALDALTHLPRSGAREVTGTGAGSFAPDSPRGGEQHSDQPGSDGQRPDEPLSISLSAATPRPTQANAAGPGPDAQHPGEPSAPEPADMTPPLHLVPGRTRRSGRISRRTRLVTALAAPLAVLVLAVALVAVHGRGASGSGTSTDREEAASTRAQSRDTTTTASSETTLPPDTSPPTTPTTPPSAPPPSSASEPAPPPTAAGPVDLFTDPSPALTSFAGVYGAAPPRALQVVLYIDHAIATVAHPTQREVRGYEWRDARTTGTAPADEYSGYYFPAENRFFQLAEIDPAIIPTVAAKALSMCTRAAYMSAIVIERHVTTDQLLLHVYVTTPDMEDIYEVEFTTDGTLAPAGAVC